MDSSQIIGAVESVTKAWAKQRKAEDRHASARSRREKALIRARRTTIKEATEQCIKAGYLKASSNGTLPAMARQIMYACRGAIQETTGEQLDDKYFTQTLLPNYMIEHPQETENWVVDFDARGHFVEPHTQRTIPLGTANVGRYLANIKGHEVGPVNFSLGNIPFPTLGPEHRYSAILFIEKEGFMSIFEAVGLQERFDIAIMSTKGMSVTAARLLVDRLRIPLLVLHDFDKAGFSIIGTFQRDTRRYKFLNKIEVIDMGLRLKDVQKWGLESEEVNYGRSDPRGNLRKNGATKEEVEFLSSGNDDWDGYTGRRVELNAFTSQNLVTWIESKLKEHGIKKVVPDQATLENAYRRFVQYGLVNEKLQGIMADAAEEAAAVEIPKGLAKKVARRLNSAPSLPWDKAIDEIRKDETDSS